MALITLPSPIQWPGNATGSTYSATFATSATLTSATVHYVTYVLTAREDMTINHVMFRTGTVSGTTPVIEARIETVDATGFPSGTLWNSGTTNDCNGLSASLASNTAYLVALTGAAVIPRGSVFAVKLLLASGTTPSVVLQEITGYIPVGTANVPYRVINTGTPTKGSLNAAQVAAVGSSSTTFYQVQGLLPATVAAVQVFSNVVAGTRRGMVFTVPYACRAIGLRLCCGNQTGNYNAMLTDNSGTELSSCSVAVDGDTAATGSSGVQHIYFDNPVSLSTGVTYRVVQEPTSASNTAWAYMTMPSSIYKTCYPGSTHCSAFTYTTASGYVDDAVTVPLIDIIIDQIDDGTGSGGGGGGVIGVIGS